MGKEFIEDHPEDFAAFFDNKACFNDTDLQTWAKIALLEFAIIDEHFITTGKGEPLVKAYCGKLMRNSQGFPEHRRETIRKSCGFLWNEWSAFLKNKS